MVNTNTQYQSPLHQVIFAGGIGGGTADFMMHGLDTVKTRLQGQPHPPKYLNLTHTFRTLIKEEGFRRGLYGGIQPAMIGSIGGTMVYFGAYEGLKRRFEQHNISATPSHLMSAGLSELLVSVIYVPSEVLKTRMQLQGRYNNPHFDSGYNYSNWSTALRTIIKNDGLSTLYRGYRATLLRDVPCTALQFAIYEKFQAIYKQQNIPPIPEFAADLFIGGLAGAIAGGVTTPLDVVKTVLQTQREPKETTRRARPKPSRTPLSLPRVPIPSTLRENLLSLKKLPSGGAPPYARGIVDGLYQSYRSYGARGLFRGLAPRVVWMGFQSAILFVIYEKTLAIFSSNNIELKQ